MIGSILGDVTVIGVLARCLIVVRLQPRLFFLGKARIIESFLRQLIQGRSMRFSTFSARAPAKQQSNRNFRKGRLIPDRVEKVSPI